MTYPPPALDSKGDTYSYQKLKWRMDVSFKLIFSFTPFPFKTGTIYQCLGLLWLSLGLLFMNAFSTHTGRHSHVACMHSRSRTHRHNF